MEVANEAVGVRFLRQRVKKYGEKMFGEHRLKSGLAKQVSFRAEVIRVAPL